MNKQIHKPTWPFVKTVEVKQRIHVLYYVIITAIQCSFSKVLILKHATSLNGIRFIRERKRDQKENLILDTSLPFLHTFQFSSIFIRIRFRFSFVFVFFLSHTNRTNTFVPIAVFLAPPPPRRSNPPAAAAWPPDPYSSKLYTSSAVRFAHPIPFISRPLLGFSLLPNSRVLGIMVSSVWDCNARAVCNFI